MLGRRSRGRDAHPMRRTARPSRANWLALARFGVVVSCDDQSFLSRILPMSDRREFLKKTGIAAGAIAASSALRTAEAAAGVLMAPPSPVTAAPAPMDAAT